MCGTTSTGVTGIQSFHSFYRFLLQRDASFMVNANKFRTIEEEPGVMIPLSIFISN